MNDDNGEVIRAYTKVIKALEPLDAEQQQRVLEATNTLLGYTVGDDARRNDGQ